MLKRFLFIFLDILLAQTSYIYDRAFSLISFIYLSSKFYLDWLVRISTWDLLNLLLLLKNSVFLASFPFVGKNSIPTNFWFICPCSLLKKRSEREGFWSPETFVAIFMQSVKINDAYWLLRCSLFRSKARSLDRLKNLYERIFFSGLYRTTRSNCSIARRRTWIARTSNARSALGREATMSPHSQSYSTWILPL